MRRLAAETFWSKVAKTNGCWEYTSRPSRQGYGRVLWAGREALAHRVSWTLTRGDIPEGKCVLHRCDNPPCVRPSHLFLGSQADNVADMMAKGRGKPARVLGEKHGRSKVTEKDVRSLRKRRHAGETVTALSASFGLSIAQVSRICRGLNWTHVT